MRALGGHYLPYMTGQPDLDKRMFAKYRTGLPEVDAIADLAVTTMPTSRFRELSIAAAEMWDGIKLAQTQAISQEKSARQALEDNNVLVQRALDQAWQSAPK